MSERSEWSDEDLDEREFPEDEDLDDDEPEFVDCPHCGGDVYEEAQQCPHCGEYITHSTGVLAGKPWWFVALAVLGILAVIWGSIQFG